MSRRVNVGCGQRPTTGWQNYDNSWSIRLAKIPWLANLLSGLGLLSTPQKRFITFAKTENIQWANATKHIPEQDSSVDVVYTSHMVEHMGKEEVARFLNEVRRILKSGGIFWNRIPFGVWHVF